MDPRTRSSRASRPLSQLIFVVIYVFIGDVTAGHMTKRCLF